jgi:hypothetical protein
MAGSAYSDIIDYTMLVAGTAGSLLGLLTNPEVDDDPSRLYLDDVPMPGIVQGEDVRQDIEWEQVPIEGRSGSVKLYHGYSDADVRLTLRLTTDDPDQSIAEIIGEGLSGDLAALYGSLFAAPGMAQTALQKLSTLDAFFKMFAKGGVAHPRIFKIGQEHVNARGITKVQFSGFGSFRSSSDDTVDVELTFMEYEPAMVLYETGAAAPPPDPPAPAPDTTDPF